jgi:hypothetical protein
MNHSRELRKFGILYREFRQSSLFGIQRNSTEFAANSKFGGTEVKNTGGIPYCWYSEETLVSIYCVADYNIH